MLFDSGCSFKSEVYNVLRLDRYNHHPKPMILLISRDRAIHLIPPYPNIVTTSFPTTLADWTATHQTHPTLHIQPTDHPSKSHHHHNHTNPPPLPSQPSEIPSHHTLNTSKAPLTSIIRTPHYLKPRHYSFRPVTYTRTATPAPHPPSQPPSPGTRSSPTSYITIPITTTALSQTSLSTTRPLNPFINRFTIQRPASRTATHARPRKNGRQQPDLPPPNHHHHDLP